MGFFKRIQVPPADSRALKIRAQTYEAISDLFSTESALVGQSIDIAANAPCAWVGQAHLPSPDLAEAARRVLEARSADWYDASMSDNTGSAQAPLVSIPTCESSYLSTEAHADRLLLENLYACAGYYVTNQRRSEGLCAGHMATELGFMAHVLRRQATGDSAVGVLADRFFAEHLYRWAHQFSAAVLSGVECETQRFAAQALSAFLECERVVMEKRGVSLQLSH